MDHQLRAAQGVAVDLVREAWPDLTDDDLRLTEVEAYGTPEPTLKGAAMAWGLASGLVLVTLTRKSVDKAAISDLDALEWEVSEVPKSGLGARSKNT